MNSTIKKTYWQNLTAPLTKEEKILRYWCCFVFCFIIICVIIYKFQNDVMYELQFQFYLISKKYFWLTSNSFCLILIIIFLLGVIFHRWWYWFINNIWLTLVIFAKNKMEMVDVYREAMFNGIIMTREYFNHNWNFYLYKALTEQQVATALKKEYAARYSSISFHTYDDCRYGYFKDPWVENFFENFCLDLNDVKSYERIRNQIDNYQINKIKEGRVQMDMRDLEYIRDHPIEHCLSTYIDPIITFVSDYSAHIILGSIASVVVVSFLYYNIVESNFKENCIYMLNRWIENGGNPVINPKGKLITEPVLVDFFNSKMIQIFGENNPELYVDNLKVLVTYNAELLRHFSTSPFMSVNLLKDINPDLVQKAVTTMLPQTVSQMVPQMLETQDLSIELIEKIIQILS